MNLVYTLARFRASGDWFLDIGAGRLFLLVKWDGHWYVFAPGLLVAKAPTRGAAVSAVLREYFTTQ